MFVFYLFPCFYFPLPAIVLSHPSGENGAEVLLPQAVYALVGKHHMQMNCSSLTQNKQGVWVGRGLEE